MVRVSIYLPRDRNGMIYGLEQSERNDYSAVQAYRKSAPRG